jgi:hypothetical protein
MKREVVPEILDRLPPEDPAARASRRDLRRINAWMGNETWLESVLRSEAKPGDKILELGAGDGALAGKVRPALPESVRWTGLDLAPKPDRWEGGWIQGDLLEAGWPEADIVVANLVLHHFGPEALERLGRRIPAGVRTWVANEPARRARHVWQTRLLFLLGANAVTRHDAPASVRAGFAGDELPEALGFSEREWAWRVELTGWGAYRFVGKRR